MHVYGCVSHVIKCIDMYIYIYNPVCTYMNICLCVCACVYVSIQIYIPICVDNVLITKHILTLLNTVVLHMTRDGLKYTGAANYEQFKRGIKITQTGFHLCVWSYFTYMDVCM
jgi:hypothetical protein